MPTIHKLYLALALMCLVAACDPPGSTEASREPDPTVPISPDLKAVSPGQSAGVFIGVETFRNLDSDKNVLYAVNDAVDLAYALSIEHHLLPPDRVRLLLSGKPSGGSVKKLADLMEANASRSTAMKSEIKTALGNQAAKVGSEGVLYVFLATHGFFNGRQYFLAEDSRLPVQETAVSEETILQTSQALSGGQTVIIQDTCRTEFQPAQAVAQPVQPDLPASLQPVRGIRSATPADLVNALARRRGYAVFFATGPRNAAGADPKKRNGFFTGAILDGLQCNHPSTDSRVIPLAGLASFVQDTVRERSTNRQDPQLLTAEGFKDFPLVRCGPIAEILEPRAGDSLCVGTGVARVRVYQSGFYATAVLYAERAGTYFHQQPDFTTPAEPDSELRLPVEYGASDAFQVYVGLTSDRDFQIGKEQLSQLFPEDQQGRPIYWLGPVSVTAKERDLKGDCQ